MSMLRPEEEMNGIFGTIVVDSSNSPYSSAKFVKIMPREDSTQVDSISGTKKDGSFDNDDDTNLAEEHNILNKNMIPGIDIFTPMNNRKAYTQINVTSGSVLLVLSSTEIEAG